ncbi:MAG: Flp pilus assembly protein TadG [Verrucomicrobiales bacterium]|jgi:Flp pilus assembly protein TadG
MRRSGESRGEDRGQVTVEFALVLPLLVLCIAGLIWVGNVVALQVRLEHAAREGARAAAVEPERALTVASAAVGRSLGDAVVSVAVDAEFVVVDVESTARGLPLVGIGERTLHAQVHMRREDINE